MTFSPTGALRGELIPMTAVAASKAATRRSKSTARQAPCKLRASYLKPKEIRRWGFDLRHPLNYLKVMAPPHADMIAS
jgi:hypothetical protein